MFYPECPKCGGQTTHHVKDEYEENNWRKAPHALGSTIHPAAGMAASAVNAIRNVAKRTSLMEKICKECGHTFY